MENCDAVNLSTVISSVMVLLNIFLNAVFIFGMFGVSAMGAEGAALATVLSIVVQMAWSTVFVTIKMKKLWVGFCLKENFRKQEFVKRFWNKTAPMLLNELVWGGGFTMYSVIMGHLETCYVVFFRDCFYFF